MRSRMSSSRGPQRIVITVAVLMGLAVVVQYWRLRTINIDLTEQLVKLEGHLQVAEEKSSRIDSQRKEVGEDLHKVKTKLQQMQITGEEEALKCKHLQENLEELVEKRESLQKELEDDKENHTAELRDMAAKLKSLQAELTESRRRAGESGSELSRTQQELETVRRQLTAAQQTGSDAASCRAQLTQAQSELAKCQPAAAGQYAAAAGQTAVVAGQPAVVAGQPAVVAGQPAVVAGQPAVVAGQPAVVAGQPAVATEAAALAAASGVSRGAWPGLKPPQPGVSQQLFESAGLAGGSRQAQDRVGLPASQQRVLPVPPGAGPAAKSSSTTTSTARPALGQELDPLDKPKSRQEAVEGAGVLAPPRQHEGQHEEPAAEREPQLGLDGDDGGLQYPMESGKEAMNDHPDIDAEADAEADAGAGAEAKDVALIKGLQELSNKSGRHEELPGPEPQGALGEGGMSAPEMVGAVPAPELPGDDQPQLPLR